MGGRRKRGRRDGEYGRMGEGRGSLEPKAFLFLEAKTTTSILVLLGALRECNISQF